jgi:hypothetical protein
LVLSAVLAGSALPVGQAAVAPSLLLRNVTVIDGNGGAPRAGVNVLIRDGRIAS